MAISGKVTASTVAAAATTVVSGILAPHVFWPSVQSDVRGLVEAGVTAVVTFASGYLARHGIDAQAVEHDVEALAEDFGVPFMAVHDVADDAPVVEPVEVAPVVEPVAVEPAPVVDGSAVTPSTPVV
jgi:hypothetical protein